MVREAYSTEKNIRATARKYSVQPHQLREWKRLRLDEELALALENEQIVQRRATAAVRANLMEANNNEVDDDETSVQRQAADQDSRRKRKRSKSACRKTGGGRKCIFQAQTISDLKGFFDEARESDLSINIRVMMAQAKLLDPVECSYITETALQHRVYRLLRKWNVSWRRGTHKAQNTRHSAKVMRDFHTYIRNKIGLLGIGPSAVYNFDETNVHFCPHLTSTYCIRGSRSVGIKENKSSQRCTVMVGCNMAGHKVPPYIIFLGANTRNGVIKRSLETKQGLPQTMEYNVQKRAWMDEITMLDWIDKVWKPTSQQHPVSLLLIDSYSTHLTSNVMRELSLCNTEVEIIPAGYTCKLQPMDVGVNKPFKGYIKHKYMEWMVLNRNLKPSRASVSEWIDGAWNHLSQNILINSFLGSGFTFIDDQQVELLPVVQAIENDDDDDSDDNITQYSESSAASSDDLGLID
jgi:transposase-like protein